MVCCVACNPGAVTFLKAVYTLYRHHTLHYDAVGTSTITLVFSTTAQCRRPAMVPSVDRVCTAKKSCSCPPPPPPPRSSMTQIQPLLHNCDNRARARGSAACIYLGAYNIGAPWPAGTSKRAKTCVCTTLTGTAPDTPWRHLAPQSRRTPSLCTQRVCETPFKHGRGGFNQCEREKKTIYGAHQVL